ncbi:MAG TPA: metal-dependent hydrolase [Gemmatimonadales bacterium]|nr:metal-dependent hydrolase [Gemmatimonadales bacterium]
MFIGHYAVGLAAKRYAPRASLGMLFIAATLSDLLWPILVLFGSEQSHIEPGPNPFLTLWLDDVPISHSLLTLAVWGGVLAWTYRRRTGDKRAALALGLLVVSHWVLDVLTHRPDQALYPGGPELGLGLWNFPRATVLVETAMLVAGIAIYLRATRARDAIGRWGFWGLIVLLAGGYYSSLFTPPPGDIKALAIGGIIFGWVFVLVAWWADRHRDAITSDRPIPL